MTTDFIEPARIERGEIPGWVQLSTDKEIAITVIMELYYTDALPERPEDLGSQPPFGVGEA